LEHEVLVTNAVRMSVTGWLKRGWKPFDGVEWVGTRMTRIRLIVTDFLIVWNSIGFGEARFSSAVASLVCKSGLSVYIYRLFLSKKLAITLIGFLTISI
jgi:hypothetical protein